MPTAYLRSDKVVQGLDAPEGGRRTWWDDRLGGFGVRVDGRSGARSFVVKTRVDGRQRFVTLGRLGDLTTTEARKAAQRAMGMADVGKDPRDVFAQRGKRGAGPAPDFSTFRALAEAVLDRKAETTSPATDAARRSWLENHILPAFGDKAPQRVTYHDVEALAERIRADGKATTANRVISTVRLVCNHKLARVAGVVDNPADAVEQTTEKKSPRPLERDELKAVWAALAEESPIMAGIFKLNVLTITPRIGKTSRARWDQLTLTDDGRGYWEVPASLAKSGRPHITPLSTAAREVVEAVRAWGPEDGSEWVFPTPRSTSKRCRWCRDQGHDCGHVREHKGALARTRKTADVAHWVAHNFRDTAATWMARPIEPLIPGMPTGLGIPQPVVDGILGHRLDSGVLDHYRSRDEAARTHLLAERRAALEAWGEWVRKAVGGRIVGEYRP